MKELDLHFYFGFDDGYTAEEEAYSIDFSDDLYDRLREIYMESGETNLGTILECEELSAKQRKELKKIIKEQRKDLIDVQRSNGDDYDPDTGEEYDFSELIVDIEIIVPEDWED